MRRTLKLDLPTTDSIAAGLEQLVCHPALTGRAREPRLALGARLAPSAAAALESMLGALSGPPVAVVADAEMAPGGWSLGT